MFAMKMNMLWENGIRKRVWVGESNIELLVKISFKQFHNIARYFLLTQYNTLYLLYQTKLLE